MIAVVVLSNMNLKTCTDHLHHSHCHHQRTNTRAVLQAECPSCCLANSVKALKVYFCTERSLEGAGVSVRKLFDCKMIHSYMSGSVLQALSV